MFADSKMVIIMSKIKKIYTDKNDRYIFYLIYLNNYKYPFIIRKLIDTSEILIANEAIYAIFYYKNDFGVRAFPKNKLKEIKLFEIAFCNKEWKKIINFDIDRIFYQNSTAKKYFELFKKYLEQLINCKERM